MKKCKNCGNNITSGDGRNIFCSRSCAGKYNTSRRTLTDETKRKIRESIRLARNSGRSKTPTEGKPIHHVLKVCIACGEEFDARNNRSQKACSLSCKQTAYKQNLYGFKGKLGGYRIGGGRGKSGWYKGIWCDSSYELAWVMYHLDHKIPFKRNKMSFQYEYENEIHSYYPDFLLLEENKLVEIKGFYTEQIRAKLNSVKDIQLIVIDKDTIHPYIEYAISNYGKDFVKHYDV